MISPTRDLIGALCGQSLIAEFSDPFGISRGELQRFFESCPDRPLPAFKEFVDSELKAFRLGNYFEALIKYALVHLLKMERVSSNVPVTGSSGQTLGEMDFVYWDPRRKEEVHLEVATKFYLYWNPEGGAPETKHFVGTMLRDRLDLKLEKLKGHQLGISRRPEARPVLERLGYGSPVSRALAKGRLFYPLGSDWRTHPSPSEVSREHDRGWWAHTKALDPARYPSVTRWMLLPRFNWLTGGGLWEGAGSLSTEELLLQNCDRPRMVAELQPDSDAMGLYREVSRGMLLPDSWPEVLEKY